jgi:hypothetical protein
MAEEKVKKVDTEAKQLAFNRLGQILYEIAQDSVDDSGTGDNLEGGGAECEANDREDLIKKRK